MFGSSPEELSLATGVAAVIAGVAGSIGFAVAIEKLPGLLDKAGFGSTGM
ncbi:hypothetical protein [Tomitella biformata]|nr:hypothetical protein [Tomitella biformata]